MNLRWIVYRYNYNKEIVEFNVFEHERFLRDVKKHLKKCDTIKEFSNEVRSDVLYYFWAKCEYEVVVTSWPPHINREELDRLKSEDEASHKDYNPYVNLNVGKKIDICAQIMLNYDVFINYLWSHKGAH